MTTSAAKPVPASVEDVFPLSPMQQGMLFHTLGDSGQGHRGGAPESAESATAAVAGSGVYVEQIRLALGGLDAALFEQAWRLAFARHRALRTSVAGVGRRQPAQVVRREVALPWHAHDVSGLADDAARQAWIDALLARDAAQGFALDEPSLVRLHLIRTGADSHEFVWTLHHIVLDGWSGSLVLRDVFQAYHALRRGEAPPDSAPRSFREYIVWVGRQDAAQAESHWRAALAGAPAAPRLPGDRAASPDAGQHAGAGLPAVQTYARTGRLLGPDVLAALRKRAGAARVTLNTLLQGAWALTLGRACGEDEFVLGTISSGRPESLPGVEELVGMFVNTLPLRVPLDPAAATDAWLADIQARQSAMRDFEASPLWEVQRWAGLPPGRRLFENLFVFQNYPADPSAMGGDGLTVAVTPPFDRTGYPLMLIASPSDGLELQLTYDADRFGSATIERWLDHLTHLLDQLGSGRAATLGDLELVDAAERTRVVEDFNATAREYPACTGLHRLFFERAAATPDALALIDATDDDVRMSYGELAGRAGRLGRHLTALGVRTDARVGVCCERSPAMVTAVLGALAAGGAYVPLDPGHPAERLAYMLADADIAVIVVHAATRDRVEALVAEAGGDIQVVCLDRDAESLTALPSTAPAAPAGADDLAYVLYTSGSTGRPKGVAMPHGPLWNLMHWQAEQSGDQAGAVTLQFSPLGFDVSCQELFATLGAGGTLCLIDEDTRRDAAALAGVLDSRRVARLCLPFVALQQLCQVAVETGRVPGALREVITAGEQLVVGPAVRAFFEALSAGGTDARLVNQYGPTECHVVSAHTLSSAPADWPGLPPIGAPIANVRLYVLDERRRPLPVGLPGELCIGGAAVARGYLGDAERTAASFVSDPFVPGGRMYRTGDRARFLDDGSVEYLGRGDDQVKLRGFRVELGEVEAVAMALPGVSQAVAVVREDRPGDRRLVLAYVPAGADAPGPVELRDALRERLPDYMVPAGLLRLDSLPKTTSGKLDRRALLGPDYAPVELRAAHVAPRGPVEQLLAELWSEVLGVAAPGTHDDFFDLGGHSLSATQLVSRVRSTLRIELPLRALFEHPTIAGLARDIARRSADASVDVPLVARAHGGDAPLSFAQQRLWFLDQVGTDAAYNMPWAFRLTGELDGDALERSLAAIVARHESLRTCFVAEGGKPRQRVLPELDIPLVRVDLSGLDAATREAELARLADHEAETPFDLEHGPLFRPSLVRLGPAEHALFLSLHHIIFDGWSIGVLNRELLEHYRADLAGEQPKPPAVPELSVQYADFVDWQNRWLPGDVLERQFDYWRGKLGGRLAVLDLPTDGPRPANQTFRGAGHLVTMDPELTRGLKVLSRRRGVTLAMTLLAGFKTLLQRYTGQDDIAVGTPIANRTQAKLENLIGFFVNSLVLRTDLSGDPSFTELLERVHTTALEAYEHQDLPFERLVDELAPERDPSRNPLFQVVFAMQNAPADPLRLPGLDIGPLSAAATRATRFDLELHVNEGPDGLQVGFCYNRDLFDAGTIERMAAHFDALLRAVVADPSRPVSRLPMLLDDERRLLLEEWNDTSVRFATDQCLHERFAVQVAATPDAVAVTCEGASLTYRQLDERSNRIARLLRDRGVGPDVLVGLCLDRGLDLVAGIVGVLKAGGGYVPLDLANPTDRIAFILEDSAVTVLVTETSQLEKLPAASGQVAEVLCLDRDAGLIDAADAGPLEPLARPENVAYVIYTSGSTGKPKGVLVEHRNATRLFDATAADCAFGPDDVWTLFHSCAFDFSVWELWGALLHGGRLVVVPYMVSRAPDEFRQLLASEGVTVLNQTPSAFRSLMAADERAPAHPPLALRLVIFGGEALDLQSLAPWFARHGDTAPQLVNMYGITETTVHVTWRPIRAADLTGAPGSVIGRPLSDLTVYVLDAAGQPVPLGVPGELYVGGAGVARGYLRRPELTAERFVPDPFRAEPGARLYRTGDIGRILPGRDGAAFDIEYLGRNDDQVKIRGYRIELGEIEAAVSEHPWVAEAVVQVVTDEHGDKKLVGYVVPDPEGADVEAGELVSQWASLYDDTYSAEAPGGQHEFNIIGWNSSYTGAPIPAAEMAEWVDQTVAPILCPGHAAPPRRVLEIGCGTGLLMFRVAPHVERYLGFDFSQAAVDSVSRHVATIPELAGKVELRRGEADSLTGIEPQGFDAVIINSVIQYVPSMGYLAKVLETAVGAVAAGGRVHVGDVRDLRLLAAQHASVQLFQADGDLGLDELATRVAQRVAQEEELVVDPACFHALKAQLPRISRVEVSPKRGAAHNELTRFRYQVTLHIEEAAPPAVADTWLDAREHDLDLAGIARRLEVDKPAVLAVRGIVNARMARDAAAAARLVEGAPGLESSDADALRAELAAECVVGGTLAGIDPQALVDLGTAPDGTLRYRVSLSTSRPADDGRFDVLFVRADAPPMAFPEPATSRKPWEHYGNHPLQAKLTRQLAPKLREALERRLPGYMVPSAFVMLEALPLTANGKIDRRALPDPDWFLPQRQGAYLEPRTETQQRLAGIWADLLGVDQIGLDDDFFELGGHSLLATQVVSRIRDLFGVELGLRQLFDTPTIEELAVCVEELAGAEDADGERESGEL